MGSPSDIPPRPERETRARVERARAASGTNGHGPEHASERRRPNQILFDPEEWGHDATD